MSNQNSIFRKASLERVSSPDQLNDYIKVSQPGVWLILGAVVILLIGMCIWGIYGALTTTCDAVTVVQNGKATCYVTPEQAAALRPGLEVSMGDQQGSITAIASTPVKVTNDFDDYALYLSGLEVGDWVVLVAVDIAISDGTYMANIVLESISPISFVLN